MQNSVIDIVVTPVLNLGTGNLVLIPLDNPIVTEHGKVFLIERMGEVLGIEGDDYKELMGLLDVEERNLALEKAYFLMNTNKSMSNGDQALSLFARDLMFERFVDAGCNMKMIMERTVKGNWKWYEQTPSQFLDRAMVDADDLSEVQALDKAVEYINSSPTISLAATHEIEGQTYLLYFNHKDLAFNPDSNLAK